VYGGAEQQNRSQAQVWPVMRMHEMLDAVYGEQTTKENR